MRLKVVDDQLRVWKRIVIGFRAEVKGVWCGPTRRTRQDAVADMAARRAEVKTP